MAYLQSKDHNSSRVGDDYQCAVDEWSGQRIQSTVRDEQVQLMWRPGVVSDDDLDLYLQFGRNLFADESDITFPSAFCEQRGLFFLQQCNYKVDIAIELLKPTPQENAMIDGDDEPGDGDDFCLVCGDGGNLMLCDTPNCHKAFHPGCLRMDRVPEGHWECPRHFCQVCHDPLPIDHPLVCLHCPNAFCVKHLPPELTKRANSSMFEFQCPECVARSKSRLVNSTGKSTAMSKKSFYDRLLRLVETDDDESHTLEIPKIGRTELDLYTFYKEVVRAGGIQNVLTNVGWGKIKSVLGLSHSSSVDKVLRDHYIHLLYSYEQKYFADSMPLDAQNI